MHQDEVCSRTALFVSVLLVIGLVGDGLPLVLGSALSLQMMLLPITALFLFLVLRLLELDSGNWLPAWAVRLGGEAFTFRLTFLFELLFVFLFFYETRHFSRLGYRLAPAWDALVFAAAVFATGYVAVYFRRITARGALAALLGSYVAGHALAIFSFPLNYLRSDMLPVIFWADRAMLAGQNPYQHFHVADRIYDFPYLPGMLLAFVPAQALHVDLRWAAIAYLVGGMLLIFWATLPEQRLAVTGLIGLFVLDPYLQYRHELYTQGHFFTLILVFVLMQRRRFGWSAVVFGVSMVISQFSWVIFPFFLMNGLRRGGWKEVGRMGALASVSAGLLMGPFLLFGASSIAHNSVGQWDNLGRAIARPINLAFWASYLVRPSQLKWMQLVLLTAIFGFCWLKGRCGDLTDTLRWMIAALTVFLLFNVLIDGYFYLMLLVPMLVYTCVANGWWAPRGKRSEVEAT